MLAIAVLLLVLALYFFWQSSKRRKAAGLPGGRVIYADTSQWGEVTEALYDPAAGLTGKPDYLVRQGKKVIPVEVKSGRVPDAPYDSHIFQVAAYCFLVEKEFGQRPPYGIIHYGSRSFAVDYTKELELMLMELVSEMRRMERWKNVARSHEHAARCHGCGVGHVCDQRL